MSSNNFTGPIDIEWEAKNLKHLVLSDNAFSGSIPDAICSMSKLGEILLS